MAAVGHDRITADGKKFFAEIEKLKKLQVRVGYQRSKSKENNAADLVDVAAWNELGTVHIPARPFMRMSVDDNKEVINKMCESALSSLNNGATAEDILTKLGVMQKGLVRKKISDGEFVPNADITIKGGWMRRKGGKAFYIKGKKSSRPLVGDTGMLHNSVQFIIEKKGGGKD